VAGLATAYQLERLGYRVEVLEGSGRPGGRVHTQADPGRRRLTAA
jgi:monoamine oxidase